MLLASLTFSARDWFWPAAGALLLGMLGVLWTYRSGPASPVKWLCAGLKVLGVATLALCLLEPLWSGQRARPGANLFAIVADNSQGLQIQDKGEVQTRAEQLAQLLTAQQTDWQAALAANYDVRRFSFDTRLQSTRDFSDLKFDGQATALGAALRSLKERFEGRPLAGVLLLTDGNATDLRHNPLDSHGLPPIYPVVIGRHSAVVDAAIAQVNITQSAFEDAPVTVQADVTALGLSGEALTARLLDAAGKRIGEQSLRARKGEDTLAFRFQFRPEKPGLAFYHLHVRLQSELAQTNA
ncbi:MAG TPA: vWA domain-containing protein, partial [Candidatus Sulfotelmatobacter sp.]|nr:vWA domain-containing protein [Candidatus Sulfotelmatobacter sp.]